VAYLIYQNTVISIAGLDFILAIAVDKSGWKNRKNLPQGQGIGLAVHYSFQSYVAMAVYVEVKGDEINVLNVDCG
jgi:isoquinoline 1-oxidoreductase beta subunit